LIHHKRQTKKLKSSNKYWIQISAFQFGID
jgi:hypothetical protein